MSSLNAYSIIRICSSLRLISSAQVVYKEWLPKSLYVTKWRYVMLICATIRGIRMELRL